MPEPKLIRGIVLSDVVGRVLDSDPFRFVAAQFEFDADWDGNPRFSLRDHVGESGRVATAISAVNDDFSADFWCVARIAAEFGVIPPSGVTALTYSVLNVGFMASWLSRKAGRRKVMPFICQGDNEDATLIFRKSDEETKTAKRIAKAFWGLLTSQPTRLAPLDFLWFDGYGYESDWGNICSFDGRILISDTHDDDPERERELTNPHMAHLWYPDGLLCLECDGSGEESFCPAGEVCEFCDGTGFAN